MTQSEEMYAGRFFLISILHTIYRCLYAVEQVVAIKSNAALSQYTQHDLYFIY